MAIKDIVVALAPRDGADPARDYALAMANAHKAHLTATAYPIVADVPGSVFPAFAAGLVQNFQHEAEASVQTARERFEQAARTAGVAYSFHGASALLNAATTDFAIRLRTADVGVLTQYTDDPEHYGDAFLEAALFRSGRPVIIVPKAYAGKFSTERVLIAWDGGVHAARAVAGAMALLEGANIEVFTVEEVSKGRDFRGHTLVDHLRRHGLNAGIAQRSDADIPAALVKEAELFRASLVVMGGYGHWRFRELVFGGATRHMLGRMPVPVLMTH